MGNAIRKQKKGSSSKGMKKVKGAGTTSAEDIVIQKLRKGNKQANSMPEDELREWSRSLCVKSELIEWYLNPEFATTVKIVCNLCM